MHSRTSALFAQLNTATDFVCELSHFDVLTIQGPDYKTYLQGQVTCDVLTLSDSQYLRGAHCDAKGKMWSNFVLAHFDNTALWVCHNSAAPYSLQQLKKFGVFSKSQFADGKEQWALFGFAGANAASWLQELNLPVPEASLAAVFEHGCVLNLGYGFLVIFKRDELANFKVQLGETAPVTKWQLLEIAQGVAQMHGYAEPHFVPQQLNLQAINAINFKKGCYIGQETVARMHYLGRNKRALYALQGPECPNPDELPTVEMAVGEHWRGAGETINAVTIGGHSFVLAVLPNDTEPQTQLRFAQCTGTVQILPLPYELNAQ